MDWFDACRHRRGPRHRNDRVLFLRSPGGLSHHPDETVLPRDVEAALTTAMEFLAQLRDDRTNPEDGHA